jgi:hypothetical protein
LRHRTLKLGLVAATALSAALPLMASPAFADYNPSPTDVVGVGSDTLQNMIGFLAEGDAYGDGGYNQIGNSNKLVSFDATADANVRLAYGSGGLSGTCGPGTGGTAGTGNQSSTHADSPCTLNPTIVLRSGMQAVQRPNANGSGAGFKALVQDIVAGHNTPGSNEVINFSRASGAQSTTATLPSGENIDQLSIATDPLPMTTSATHTGTDTKTTDYALSANQLSLIYSQSTCAITWSDPRISGAVVAGATVTSGSNTITEPSTGPQVTSADVGGTVTGTDVPAGATVATVGTHTFTITGTAPTTGGTETVTVTNPSASADVIQPIIPQVGSGTRSYFIAHLSPAITEPVPGCATVSEENDPTAIASQTHPADAITPVSAGRFDIFKGVTVTGANGFSTARGYFLDPSCAYLVGTAGCGTGTVGGGSSTYKINPISVANFVQQTTGTPADGNALFDPTRTLFLYVRSSDLTTSVTFQPTGTLNFVKELFYNPAANGTTIPFPYIEQGEGQTLLMDAGVTPISVTCLDITTSVTC